MRVRLRACPSEKQASKKARERDGIWWLNRTDGTLGSVRDPKQMLVVQAAIELAGAAGLDVRCLLSIPIPTALKLSSIV